MGFLEHLAVQNFLRYPLIHTKEEIILHHSQLPFLFKKTLDFYFV